MHSDTRNCCRVWQRLYLNTGMLIFYIYIYYTWYDISKTRTIATFQCGTERNIRYNESQLRRLLLRHNYCRCYYSSESLLKVNTFAIYDFLFFISYILCVWSVASNRYCSLDAMLLFVPCDGTVQWLVMKFYFFNEPILNFLVSFLKKVLRTLFKITFEYQNSVIYIYESNKH